MRDGVGVAEILVQILGNPWPSGGMVTELINLKT